jgi:hypothetical protein
MDDLQALVTGMIAGSLMKQEGVALDVEVAVDEDGNYEPELLVTGRNSRRRLLVTVAMIEDE